MLIILFSIAVGVFIVWIQLRNYLKMKEFIKSDAEERKTSYQMKEANIYLYVLQIGLSIASILFAILDSKNNLSIAVGIILSLAFLSQVFTTMVNRRLYYSESGFIHGEKYYRYKSIKEYASRKRAPGIIEIVTFNGEVIPMPRSNAALIKEMAESK